MFSLLFVSQPQKMLSVSTVELPRVSFIISYPNINLRL